MSRILVSIISYGEKDLKKTVLDCYNKRSQQHEILFSIVDEQQYEDEFCTFEEIPAQNMVYRTFDWSQYRGIDWARNLSTKVDFDYDYILYICGHTRFCQDWDIYNFQEYFKAQKLSSTGKALITYCPAEFAVTKENDFETKTVYRDRVKNVYHPPATLGSPENTTFVPAYNFPNSHSLQGGDQVFEGCYLHFTWCFGPKQFVDEVPVDPEIAFHAEESYMMVRSWCKGWRFFATPKLLSWHMSYKQYPDEKHMRINTHRPWANQHKEAFWNHVDYSQKKFNLLMSGRLEDQEGISYHQVLEYCCFSGIPTHFTNFNPDFHKLNIPRHGEHLRYIDVIPYEKIL